MEKFTSITGIAAPFIKANIDTDLIIPAKRLVGYQRSELGAFAFEAVRFSADGSLDPAFVLNRPKYHGVKILITGENFGCGSSRESAVWTLHAFGLRCIVAPGFGDIFANNAFQNGMLLITLPKAVVEKLALELEQSNAPILTADLQAQTIVNGRGEAVSFAIDAERRAALLEGRDEISATLLGEDAISAFQSRDRLRRPWVHQTLAKPAISV